MLNEKMRTSEVKMPKDLSAYRGQFIVFFSDDVEPSVLFGSVLGEEAYAHADQVAKETGRMPLVYRVAASESETLMQLLATRA